MLFYQRKPELLKMLPQLLQQVSEFQAICSAEESVLAELNVVIEKTADNSFINSADKEGLQRWEKILGVSSPLDSTDSSRREALIARLIAKPPINMAVLKNIIETYMGVTVDIKEADHMIKVSYRGESKLADLTPMFATVYELIPADMLLDISYRYIVWNEMDSLNLDFAQLDSKAMTWSEFEKGEWVDD